MLLRDMIGSLKIQFRGRFIQGTKVKKEKLGCKFSPYIYDNKGLITIHILGTKNSSIILHYYLQSFFSII